MVSIKFPDMLSSANTNLIQDREATASNLRLMLASWKTSLLGDPYFGTNIKRYIQQQNNIVLEDLIIDDINLAVHDFMPQVAVNRDNIHVTRNRDTINVDINSINLLDSQPDIYNIVLTQEGTIS